MSRRGTAFVTGGASGIGEAAVHQLLDQGIVRGVTVVDLDDEKGHRLAEQLNHHHHHHHQNASNNTVRCLFRKVNVCDTKAFSKALDEHVAVFGEFPRIVLLNAGIGDAQPLLQSTSMSDNDNNNNMTDGKPWKRVVDINLGAVLEGVRLVVPRMMQELSPISGADDDDNTIMNGDERGFISITASAAGIHPLPGQEVYSVTKAACVHLARALAWLDASKGIRVVTMCPAFTDTNMVKHMLATQKTIKVGSIMTPEFVASGIVKMAVNRDNKYRGGSAMVVTFDRGMELWRFAGEKRSSSGTTSSSHAPKIDPHLRQWATQRSKIGQTFRAVEIASLDTNFAAASRIVTKTIPNLSPGEALVRIAYAGINASDVNYSAGRYHGGAAKARAAMPLPAGFESVGVIAAICPNKKDNDATNSASFLVPGMSVAALYYGGFSEYQVIPVKFLLPIHNGPPRPEHLALLTSGLTASIGLERPLRDALKRKKNPTIIVTAAAGGTGQFAVQIAKLAGCRVVAVAGGERKGQLCRSLGADAVVDYKALMRDENGSSSSRRRSVYSKRLATALKQACGSGGADIVYESVGGDMFNACERCLGNGGRLIVIGMMSQYTSGTDGEWRPSTTSPGLQDRLLYKSASVEGFFLLNHTKSFRRHYFELSRLLERGDIVAAIDEYAGTGVEATAGAVAHLQGGRSAGKVVLRMSSDIPSITARL